MFLKSSLVATQGTLQLVDDKNLGNYRKAHKKALPRVLSCLTMEGNSL